MLDSNSLMAGPNGTPVPSPVLDRSVETLPPKDQAPMSVGDGGWGILAFAGTVGDEIPQWGTLIQRRDAMLRNFIVSEPFCAGAFASVIARYAAFSWTLNGGGPRTTAACQDMLLSANFGGGWADFISEITMDYLTSDKGAFVELIRTADRPDAPVIGLHALNSLQCWSTGNPEVPVIFWDQLSGQYHRLQWYQVHHLREIPMSSPLMNRARVFRLQMCALSRVLLHVKAFRSILEYLDEKTSGRHHKAIHVVAGISRNELQDALTKQENAADARQLLRYIQPVVVTALDPGATPKVATLELSTLPDGFDIEKTWRMYISCLALGLLTDYQDLAPLPGGNLGTSSQSIMLDKKAKAKGAGLFRKQITHMMNRVVLPAGVEFEFDEQDLDEDQAAALARETRAKGRSLMKATGEVDDLGARQIALDDGDISAELFEAMQQRDLTEQAIRDDEREKVIREQIMQRGRPAGPVMEEAPPTTISPSGRVIAAPGSATALPGVLAEGEKPTSPAPGVKATREEVEPQIRAAEVEAAAVVEAALARGYRALAKRLAKLE